MEAASGRPYPDLLCAAPFGAFSLVRTDCSHTEELIQILCRFQDGSRGRHRLRLRAEVVEGGQDPPGPVAADDLSDGEEWAPVVTQTIVGLRWEAGTQILQLFKIILGPAGDFASE